MRRAIVWVSCDGDSQVMAAPKDASAGRKAQTKIGLDTDALGWGDMSWMRAVRAMIQSIATRSCHQPSSSQSSQCETDGVATSKV
jgi:hypothetical protein